MKSKLLFIAVISIIVVLFGTITFVGCKEEAVEETVETEEAVEETVEIEESAKKDITLRIASYKDETAVEAMLLKEYAEKEGINWEWVTVSDYNSKLSVELMSGQTELDGIYSDMGRTAMWVTYLEDVTDLIPEDIKSQIVPGAINALSFEGRMYGLPGFILHPLLAYNKEIFSAQNIDNPPNNFDEYVEIATKCTIDENNDGIPEIFGFSTGAQPGIIFDDFVNLMDTVGGSFYTLDKKPNFNNDYGMRALELLTLLYNAEFVDPTGMSVEQPEIRKLIAGGTISMGIASGGTVEAIIKTDFPENVGKIGYAPIFGDLGDEGALDGAKEYSSVIGDAKGFAIVKDTPNLEYALGYAIYQFSPEGQKTWVENYGTVPVNSLVASDDEFIKDYPFIMATLEASEKSKFTEGMGQLFLMDEYFFTLREEIAPILEEVVLGTMDKETALADIENKVNEVRSK